MPANERAWDSKTLVRCANRMVFPVNAETLEPLATTCYDAYCYSDPESGVTYIEYSDWCKRRYNHRGQP